MALCSLSCHVVKTRLAHFVFVSVNRLFPGAHLYPGTRGALSPEPTYPGPEEPPPRSPPTPALMAG